jgi:hypothetical protein
VAVVVLDLQDIQDYQADQAVVLVVTLIAQDLEHNRAILTVTQLDTDGQAEVILQDQVLLFWEQVAAELVELDNLAVILLLRQAALEYCSESMVTKLTMAVEAAAALVHNLVVLIIQVWVVWAVAVWAACTAVAECQAVLLPAVAVAVVVATADQTEPVTEQAAVAAQELLS